MNVQREKYGVNEEAGEEINEKGRSKVTEGKRSQKKWGEDKLVNEQVKNGYMCWLGVWRRWVDTGAVGLERGG